MCLIKGYESQNGNTVSLTQEIVFRNNAIAAEKNPQDLFEEGVCYRQQLIWSSITGILNEKITLNKLATRIDGFNST